MFAMSISRAPAQAGITTGESIRPTAREVQRQSHRIARLR
jgi:hypothetical protein